MSYDGDSWGVTRFSTGSETLQQDTWKIDLLWQIIWVSFCIHSAEGDITSDTLWILMAVFLLWIFLIRFLHSMVQRLGADWELLLITAGLLQPNLNRVIGLGDSSSPL